MNLHQSSMLGFLLLFASTARAEERSRLISQMEQKTLLVSNEIERSYWQHFKNYVRQTSTTDELNFWKSFNNDPQMLVVGGEERIRLNRHYSFLGVQPIRVHRAVICVNNACYLAAWPADSTSSQFITQLHLSSARIATENPELNALKQHLEQRITKLGPHRWTTALRKIYPAGSQAVEGELKLEKAGEELFVVSGEQRTKLNLPDLEEMESWFGFLPEEEIPPLPRESPEPEFKTLPPAAKRLLLVVDWSEYAAHPLREGAVFAAVRSGIDSLDSPDRILDGKVWLQTPERRQAWLLEEILAGNWPASLPPPHRRETLATLASGVNYAQQARERGELAAVFLTWNASLTAPEEPAEAETLLKEQFAADPRQTAQAVELQVIQVGGERVPSLRALAGRRNYNVYQQGLNNAPQIVPHISFSPSWFEAKSAPDSFPR